MQEALQMLSMLTQPELLRSCPLQSDELAARPTAVIPVCLMCGCSSVQVCQAATRHFESQPHLEFLKDMHQLTAAAIAEASEASATSQQAAAAAGSNTQPGEWFNRADGSDLVWLHFALYKYFHHGK